MVGKPPAFLFYVADFLNGTNYLTSAQVGAYIRLLGHSWDRGPIPLNRHERARWLIATRDDPEEPQKLWEAIAHKWVRTPAGFVNPRMEAERQKYQLFREKQAAKGRRSGEVRAAKAAQSNRGSTTVQRRLNPVRTVAQHEPVSAPAATVQPPRRQALPRRKRQNVAGKRESNHGSTAVEPALNLSLSMKDQDLTPTETVGVDLSPEFRPSSDTAPTTALLAHFDDRHRARLGTKAAFTRGKDAKLMTDLWRDRRGDELPVEALIDEFFAANDAFVAQAGYSVGVFVGQVPKILARLAGHPAAAPRERWWDECARLGHTPPCEHAEAHGLRKFQAAERAKEGQK